MRFPKLVWCRLTGSLTWTPYVAGTWSWMPRMISQHLGSKKVGNGGFFPWSLDSFCLQFSQQALIPGSSTSTFFFEKKIMGVGVAFYILKMWFLRIFVSLKCPCDFDSSRHLDQIWWDVFLISMVVHKSMLSCPEWCSYKRWEPRRRQNSVGDLLLLRCCETN